MEFQLDLLVERERERRGEGERDEVGPRSNLIEVGQVGELLAVRSKGEKRGLSRSSRREIRASRVVEERLR